MSRAGDHQLRRAGPVRRQAQAGGQPPALVDVTPAAVAELSLDPGTQVWLTVKATDLEVYPPGNRQGPSDAIALP